MSVPAPFFAGEPEFDPSRLPEGWALALPEKVEPAALVQPATTPGSPPATVPPAVSPTARPTTARRTRRRTRTRLHPTFMVFASIVIVVLVLGVVAMNALFAQTAFAVHSTQTRVADLAEQHDVLATDVARLSSPSRIAAWAERYQMVLPDDVVILRVPRFGHAVPERP